MRLARLASLTLVLSTVTADVFTQAPPQTGPTFDVVSIKRNTSNALGSNGSQERIDGSVTLINIPIGTLISRAYSGNAPIDMVGLPGWAMSERYDVSTTSPLQKAAPDERAAMMRAMLIDRFKLVAHLENREQPAYDLVLARGDGRLGANIKPSEVDCVAKNAAERAAAEASRSGQPPPPPPGVFDRNAPAPQCSLRLNGDRMEGDLTMETLARMLRSAAGRFVIDKTGLAGSYRVMLTFDRMAGRGPATDPAPNAATSVFVAVQEQLGLKLEPSRASREALIIDRLEHPTEN